jgi:hypothetical protein
MMQQLQEHDAVAASIISSNCKYNCKLCSNVHDAAAAAMYLQQLNLQDAATAGKGCSSCK